MKLISLIDELKKLEQQFKKISLRGDIDELKMKDRFKHLHMQCRWLAEDLETELKQRKKKHDTKHIG
jgi:hypothetical protein